MKRIFRAIVILLGACSAINAAAQQPTRQAGLIACLYELDQDVSAVPELVAGQAPSEVIDTGPIDLHDRYGSLSERVLVEIDGFLRVARPGAYEIRLTCDDGGILSLDGQVAIDHDGPHGPTPKAATLTLSAGDHALQIRHFQGTGGAALRLDWKTPGAADFVLVPRAALVSDANQIKPQPGKKRIIPPLRRGRPGDGSPVVGDHPGFRSGDAFPEGEMTFDHLSTHVRAGLSGGEGPDRFAIWVPDVGDAPLHATRLKDGRYAEQFVFVAQPGAESRRVFVDSFPMKSGESALHEQTCAFRFGKSDGRSVAPGGKLAFEMLAVRAVSNGFEIEFTKPLDPHCGWEADSIYVEQWPFDAEKGTAPKRDGVVYPAKSASMTEDRKTLFVELENLKPAHIVYLRLLPPLVSAEGELPWSTEAWYTLKEIPQARAGKARPRPAQPPQNLLTDAEKAEGWKLLFDGSTTKGWHPFKKAGGAPTGWSVVDGCLARTGSGGDIVSDEAFDNFELKIEWRVAAAGNSGIFYGVCEDDPNRWVWETGPEMQVLDNAEHADGRNALTSAASCYALYAPARDVTKPVGFFNEARIVVRGEHVEHWLNGEKLLEYEWGSGPWQEKVKASKFASMPRYGTVRTGKLALQDHGDRVWYRNIKLRPLPAK
ncbi:MAG: DUF1080 domain-containing protein [Planctomycetes bacterium]|nr:DUF1080 domain-containing protein [Planctomycetota bacterium]